MISYFKRKSQNLSTSIEAIYGLRVSNDLDKSLELASKTFTGMVDIDLESIIKAESESFIAEIKKLNFNFSYLETIVNLLHETSKIYTSLKNESIALNLDTKALNLLKYITLNDKTYSEERENQIKEIEAKLKIN